MKRRISDLLDAYEDDSVALSGGTPLSSARIRELTLKRITSRQNKRCRFIGTAALAAACLGLIFLTGRAFQVVPARYDEPHDTESAAVPDVGTVWGSALGDAAPDCCDALPGNFEPVLCVNGTYYRWADLNLSGYSGYVDGNGLTHVSTHLPKGGEGFEAVGEISIIPPADGELPGELQMQAGFEAVGTVYANPERPAVVYVLMRTGWFADAYVRFTADYYESGLIRFEDRLYWFAVGRGDLSEHLKTLPEGCVSAGTLRVIDRDLIPTGQLEINCSGDSYDHYLGGREVFRDPADDSVIYMYEEQFWREGSYPAWVACHLW